MAKTSLKYILGGIKKNKRTKYANSASLLIGKVARMEIKSHTLEGILSKEMTPKKAAEVARRIRVSLLEGKTKQLLPHMRRQISSSHGARANIELLTGFVPVPLAFVGVEYGGVPMRIRYKSKISAERRGSEKLRAILPIATTEGKLVAGLNRGADIIQRAGGAQIEVDYVGMTRAPLLKTKTAEEARFVSKWIGKNIGKLREFTKSSGISKHVDLKGVDLENAVQGSAIHPRFIFDAKDAMGMNASTTLSDRIVKFAIEEMEKERKAMKGKISYLSVSGNMCTDKKAAKINWVKGRGYKVSAEAFIPKSIFERAGIKTPIEDIVELGVEKCLRGSKAAGVVGGYNSHMANQIAGTYIATGQDAAQVAEGHMGKTVVKKVIRNGKEGLLIKIYMPAIEVGTVGGGTRLPIQKEVLRALGVAGGGKPPGANAQRLAAITATSALAGELNALIALRTGKLQKSHEDVRQLGKKIG